MNYESIYDAGRMPRTQAYINSLAKQIVKVWQTLVINHEPKWWGRQAFQNNSITIKNIPGGVQIYWQALSGGKKWMNVIEKGRPAYNIVNALLSGPRSRQGKNGRYNIVPFPVSKGEKGKRGSNVTQEIRKTGEVTDSEGKTRNKYSYKGTGKSSKQTVGRNIFKSQQKQKGGRSHYSYMKFICVSESSNWRMYPAIRAGNYQKKLQEKINTNLQGKVFKDAVGLDIADLLRKKT